MEIEAILIRGPQKYGKSPIIILKFPLSYYPGTMVGLFSKCLFPFSPYKKVSSSLIRRVVEENFVAHRMSEIFLQEYSLVTQVCKLEDRESTAILGTAIVDTENIGILKTPLSEFSLYIYSIDSKYVKAVWSEYGIS